MRVAFKVIAGILILGLLALGVFLIPPHLQVRTVTPPLPSEADFRELMDAPDGPVTLRYVTTSSQETGDSVLGHVVFIAEWANGNLFMIDAGMDHEAAAEFGELMKTAMGGGDFVINGSIDELLGSDTQRVKGVGYTHLHIDHTQGTIPFCAARGAGAARFQTSWQAELHNFNTVEGAAIVADSCLSKGELAGDALMRVDGFPGLGMVALGGHTPGSTLFAIAVKDHVWLLSGDTTNRKVDIMSNTGKGFVYSYMIVPENVARTEALRLWLAELDADRGFTVVVSHDLRAIEASGLMEWPSVH